MEITKKANKSCLEVSLEGRLDTVTSKDLEASLKDEISKFKDIHFDLSKMDYLSSAGLRLLLAYSKALGGKEHVVIVGANAVIKEIFAATAFSNFVTIK
jgi:anti-sigma B factor antagonist